MAIRKKRKTDSRTLRAVRACVLAGGFVANLRNRQHANMYCARCDCARTLHESVRAVLACAGKVALE